MNKQERFRLVNRGVQKRLAALTGQLLFDDLGHFIGHQLPLCELLFGQGVFSVDRFCQLVEGCHVYLCRGWQAAQQNVRRLDLNRMINPYDKLRDNN